MTIDDLFNTDDVFLDTEDFSDLINTDDNQQSTKPETDNTQESIDDMPDTDAIDSTVKTADDDKPEPKVDTKDNKNDTEDDNEEVDDTAELFFKYLQDKNIVLTNEDFEFDGSEEKLEEALIQTKDNLRLEVFNDLFEKLPNKVREAVKFSLQTNGRDLDEFLQQDQEIDWDRVDLSTSDNQKAVMYHYYKSVSNFEDDKIYRYIDRLVKSGDLEEEATSVIQELKDKEEENKAKAIEHYRNQQAALEEQDRQYKASIQKSIDEASYIESERKQKLKNFLFNEKRTRDGSFTEYNLVLNNISNNPSHMAQLADLLLDYKPDVGFDFERFTTKAKTAAVKGLKNKLNAIRSDAKTKVTGVNAKDNKKEFNLADFVNSLK